MVNPRKSRKNLRDDALRLALSNNSLDVLASGGAGPHTVPCVIVPRREA